MLTIYGWDEIGNEVSQVQADLPEDAKPKDVMNAWYNSMDFDLTLRNEVYYAAEMLSLTVIIGTFGRGKQFMMWWGNENITKNFAEIIGTTGED